jgi:hypothetical protein
VFNSDDKEAAPMTFRIDFASERKRRCGDCQLCCKLLPVRSLAKLAGQHCSHQRHHKGCAAYARLAHISPECRLWSCRWLTGDDTADLSRPDRSHYVIDIMPDFVTTIDNATGARVDYEVVQIWVDPGYPEAHRDPGLRAWLVRQRKLGLVRYSDTRGFVICPPNLSETGEWIERHSDMKVKSHNLAEVVAALTERNV